MSPEPRPRRLLVLAAALLVSAEGTTASAAEMASAYTKHDFGRCAAMKSPHPGVVEMRACNGYAGIKVFWTGEPDASSVAFGLPDERSLDIGPIHEVRGTIEWRGPLGSGAVQPLAAIVRYDTGASVSRLNVSRLVVYRVAAGKPSCVMAVVNGGDANQVARSIVDRHAAGFVCGTSRRLTK